MKDKKEIIKIWSIILLFTIIINILFFSFTIDSGFIWAIVIVYPLIAWDTIALVFWGMSFRVNYKNLTIGTNNIEIYAGLINHYIKVNGTVKDEYKSSKFFTPIKLSCLLNNHKLEVTISPSNHIVVKLDDELIK